MKTLFQNILLGTLLMIGANSCSKSNDTQPASTASSSWSINGTTYAAGTTVFTNHSLLSVAKVNSQETFSILFMARPAAGNYNVVASNPGNNQCVLQGTSLGGNNAVLSKGGGTVGVTISNGKIHAIFSNVPMVTVTSASAPAISGDLIEQ